MQCYRKPPPTFPLLEDIQLSHGIMEHWEFPDAYWKFQAREAAATLEEARAQAANAESQQLEKRQAARAQTKRLKMRNGHAQAAHLAAIVVSQAISKAEKNLAKIAARQYVEFCIYEAQLNVAKHWCSVIREHDEAQLQVQVQLRAEKWKPRAFNKDQEPRTF